jgi:hypothetical protein
MTHTHHSTCSAAESAGSVATSGAGSGGFGAAGARGSSCGGGGAPGAGCRAAAACGGGSATASEPAKAHANCSAVTSRPQKPQPHRPSYLGAMGRCGSGKRLLAWVRRRRQAVVLSVARAAWAVSSARTRLPVSSSSSSWPSSSAGGAPTAAGPGAAAWGCESAAQLRSSRRTGRPQALRGGGRAVRGAVPHNALRAGGTPCPGRWRLRECGCLQRPSAGRGGPREARADMHGVSTARDDSRHGRARRLRARLTCAPAALNSTHNSNQLNSRVHPQHAHVRGRHGHHRRERAAAAVAARRAAARQRRALPRLCACRAAVAALLRLSAVVAAAAAAAQRRVTAGGRERALKEGRGGGPDGPRVRKRRPRRRHRPQRSTRPRSCALRGGRSADRCG